MHAEIDSYWHFRGPPISHRYAVRTAREITEKSLPVNFPLKVPDTTKSLSIREEQVRMLSMNNYYSRLCSL